MFIEIESILNNNSFNVPTNSNDSNEWKPPFILEFVSLKNIPRPETLPLKQKNTTNKI